MLMVEIASGIDPARLEVTNETLRQINQNMNRLLEGDEGNEPIEE